MQRSVNKVKMQDMLYLVSKLVDLNRKARFVRKLAQLEHLIYSKYIIMEVALKSMIKIWKSSLHTGRFKNVFVAFDNFL